MKKIYFFVLLCLTQFFNAQVDSYVLTFNGNTTQGNEVIDIPYMRNTKGAYISFDISNITTFPVTYTPNVCNGVGGKTYEGRKFKAYITAFDSAGNSLNVFSSNTWTSASTYTSNTQTSFAGEKANWNIPTDCPNIPDDGFIKFKIKVYQIAVLNGQECEGSYNSTVGLSWADMGLTKEVNVNFTYNGYTTTPPTSITSTTPVCLNSSSESANVNFTAIGGGASQNYYWFLNGTQIQKQTGGNNISGAINVKIGDIVGVKKKNNLSGSNANCQGISNIKTIIIPQKPQNLASTGSTNYCEGQNVLITPTATESTGQAITYEWAYDSNFTQILDASKVDAQGRLNYIANGAGATQYFYRAKNILGCYSNVANVTVTVTAAITNFHVVNDNATFCNSQNISITAGGNNISNYQWFKDNLGSVPLGSGATINLTSSQWQYGVNTIYVKGTNVNCQTSLIPATFTVNQTPTNLQVTGNSGTYCIGSPILITPTATNSNNFDWSTTSNFATILGSQFVDANGRLSYVPTTAGSYTYYVRAKDSSGTCFTNPTTVTFSVNNVVSDINITPNNPSVCYGSPVTFTASATNATSYKWTSDSQGVNILGSNSTLTLDQTKYSIGANTIYLTVGNSGGCNATAIPIAFVVNPSPSNLQVSGNLSSYCTGTPILVTPTATFSGTGLLYEWSNNSNFGTILGSQFVDAQGRLSFTPATPSTTIFYVRAKSPNGCYSNVVTVPVSVYNTPSNMQITSSADVICQGQTITFTGSATNAETYTWYKDAAGTIPLGTGQSITIQPSGYLLGNNTIYAKASTSAGCQSEIATYIYIVNPSPSNLIVTGNQTNYCTGNQVLIQPSATGQNLVYQWSTNNNFTTLLDSSFVDANGNLNYVPTQVGSVTYYVRAFNGSCYTNVETVNLTVKDGVSNLQVSNNNSTVCSGQSFNFVAGATGATTYNWYKFSNATGLLATGSTYTPNSNDYTLDVEQTIYVQASNSSGCQTALLPVKYTVFTKPNNLQVSGNASNYCVGTQVLISPTANVGVGNLVYEWSLTSNFGTILGSQFVDANGRLSYVPTTAGSYTYYARAKSKSGCYSNTVTVNFTVNSNVGTVSISNNGVTICQGANATFQIGATNATSYGWYKDAAGTIPLGTGQSITIQPSGYLLGNNTIYAQANGSGNCGSALIPVTFTVNESPSNLTITNGLSNYCLGSQINVQPSATGQNLVYQWSTNNNFTTLLDSSFVDANGNLNYVPTQVGSVTYYVRAFNGSCYTNVETVNLTVKDGVSNLQVSNNNSTVCSGQSFNFVAGATGATTYNWYKFSNATGLLATGSTYTPNSNDYTLDVEQTIYVQASNSSGCQTALLPVKYTVFTKPNNLQVSGNASNYCVGTQVLISPTANVGVGNLVYEWSLTSNFGTILGSQFVDANGNLNYIPSGAGNYTYYVRAKGKSGCFSNTVTVTFTVNNAVSNVNITPNNPSVCYGSPVTFTASATNATSYKWTSDSQGVNILGSNSTLTLDQTKYSIGANTIYLIVGNGGNCTLNPVEVTFTVNESPSNLELTGLQSSYCSGSQVLISPSATGTGLSFEWSTNSNFTTLLGTNMVLQDGSLSYIPTVVGAVQLYVRAKNASGCTTAPKTINFTVNQGVSNLQVTGNGATFCQGSQISFTAGAVNANNYSWYRFSNATGLLANGSTFTPNSTQYSLGTNTIYVQALSGNNCQTELIPVTFTVYATPSNLEVTGNNGTYCIGVPIFIQPTSNGASNTVYEWSVTSNFSTILGSQFVDANGNLSYTPSSAGNFTYYVRAKGQGNCYSAPKTITFSVSNGVSNVTVTNQNASICFGSNINFTASAQNANSYTWSTDNQGANIIGNSASITLDSSLYSVGANTIYLTVANKGGCNITPMPVSFTVNESPSNLQLTGLQSSYCSGSQVLISPTLSGATSGITYQWSLTSNFTTLLGSQFVDADGNLNYIPNNSSTTTYYCRAINQTGCYSNIQSVTVIVTQGVSNMQVSNENGIFCEGQNINFTVGATGATTFNWYKFPNGTGLLHSGATYVPASTDYTLGNNTIYVQAISTNGNCTSAIKSVSFVINESPKEIAYVGETTYCKGQNVFITPSALGQNITYQWSTTANFAAQNILGANYVDANGNLYFPANNVGTTTYYVRAFNGNCYSTGIPVTITINVQPTNLMVSKLTNTNSTNYCKNGTTEQYLATGVSVTKFKWFYDQQLTQEVVASYVTGTNGNTLNVNPSLWEVGTYNLYVIGENANGCQTEPVTINFSIIEGITNVTPSINNFSICQGETKVINLDNPNNFTISWYSNSAGSQVLSSQYISNNGNTLTLPASNFPIGDNTLYYKIQNAGGCSSDLLPVSFSVLSMPTGLGVTNNSTIVCKGNNIVFQASGQNVTKFVWYQNFATGLLVDNQYISGTKDYILTLPTTSISAGTYTYQVVGLNSNGCQTAPIDVVFTVQNMPSNTSLSGNTTYCSSENVKFNLNNASAVTYKWFYDNNGLNAVQSQYLTNNGSVVSIPASSFTSGSNTLYYFTSNGNCNSTMQSVNFIVKTTPTNLNVSGNSQNYCFGNLIDIVVGSTGGATSYEWFEDANASLQVNPTYLVGTMKERLQTNSIPVGVYTYYVRAVNSNGCASALLPISFTVNATPSIAKFETSNATVIEQTPIAFNISATGYTKWKLMFNGSQVAPVGGGWNSGTPSVFTYNNTATNANQGTYTLIVSNGTCEASKNFVLYVIPKITIMHNKTNNIGIHEGESKVIIKQHETITFSTNVGSNATYKEEWNYGDGFNNTTISGQHYFNQAGQFTIKLKVTNISTNDEFIVPYELPILVQPVENTTDVTTLNPPDTTYTIYPNPYKEFLGLKYEGSAGDKFVLRVYNINGISIFNTDWVADGVLWDKKWYNPLLSAPSGTYVVIIFNVTKGTKFQAKLLKQ